MREEYQDQVQNLNSLLGKAEDRINQMELDSEYAQEYC